jgi:hypothetical protein
MASSASNIKTEENWNCNCLIDHAKALLPLP